MSSDVSASRARSPRRRAIASLVAAGTVAATVAAVGTSAPTVSADTGDTVQILSFNDYHGHIEDDTAGSIDREFGGPAAGGGEYLSAKLTELRGGASEPTESFTVAAGDNIGGSPFFSGLFKDEPSVESLNEMGLDISGVGNHEFDEGVAELLRMQNGGCFDADGDGNDDGSDDADDCFFEDDPYGGADFNWLAANVFETGVDDADGSGREETPLPEYEIRDVNGTSVAFIGMTLDGTAELVAQSGIEGFTFADEIETANALVPEITDAGAGAEAIFVLLHEGGFPTELDIDGCAGVSGPVVDINAGLSSEIDAVISGHTQEPYNCSLEDPDGNERPVVSAWEFGKVVTEMNFTLDNDGDVDRNTLDVINHPVLQSELMADPDVTDVIDKWQPLADEIAMEEVGRITADITRGDGQDDNRGIESDAGNLVADAQLFAVREADIEADVAFMNPGGVRSDLTFAAGDDEAEDGIVTFGEAFTFQPFNNTVSVLPMTGAQIKQVLLEQCQPAGGRPVLHLGVSEGFSYDLDITIDEAAGVCTEILIRDVEIDGVDVVDDEMYMVATNNFLADGGDNFETFAEVDPTDRLPGPQDIDALIDYFEANSPIAPPGTDRANEGVFPPAATALSPSRILDTRPGGETVDGDFEQIGPLAPDVPLELQVTGRGGVDDDAESVVLNIGVIRPEDLGFITVYPCDEDQPTASNLNFAGGTTVSNAVFAKLSADGEACIVSSVETQMYADVTSAVPDGGSPIANTPARLLDNRDGGITFDGEFAGGGTLAGGDILELAVTGRDAAATDPLVPDNAKAVVLNLGAIQPTAKGFLTAFPCNEDNEVPLSSNVNYIEGVNVANAVTVGIGDDGAVCIFASETTNLIADVAGFVPANGSPDPQDPIRLMDTRDDQPGQTIDDERAGEGTVEAGEVIELQVAGRGGLPDDITAANLNVTAVRPLSGGFITAYPCDGDVPNASNVNFVGTDNVANSVTALLTDSGTVCLVSSVDTQLIVDATGSVGPEPVLSFTQGVPT